MANNPQEYYELHSGREYISSVDRTYLGKYIDPLNLNFKLLLNFSRSYGLLADESNENSALAYLNRIGDDVRYQQLKNWIGVLKILNQEYDFLLMDVEGLDLVLNQKPQNLHLEDDDKFNLIFRESSDMMVQSIITTYRHIAYDDKRRVEVLPANLRKFDASILVFSAGYFSMGLYDDIDAAEPLIEQIMFPTKRKLNDMSYVNPMANKFNHLLFNFNSCQINIEESGKNFLENISNTPGGDIVMNNLSMNFKFSNYKGRFNNIMGDVDFVGLLALMAAQNKAVTSNNSAIETLKKSFGDKLKDSANSLKKSTLKTLETKSQNQLKKIKSNSSPIGDLMSKMTVKHAESLIKNTLDVGINYFENTFINNPLTQVNNLLFQNFSNDLIGVYNNATNQGKVNKNVKLIDNETQGNALSGQGYDVQGRLVTPNAITFGVDNVYTRSGF